MTKKTQLKSEKWEKQILLRQGLSITQKILSKYVSSDVCGSVAERIPVAHKDE